MRIVSRFFTNLFLVIHPLTPLSIMKKHLFSIAVLLFSIGFLQAQMTIKTATTTVLDKYENKWLHWGGDAETIKFAAVKYVSGNDSTLTMQIQVTNKDWEKSSTTSGIAVGSGYSWAAVATNTETLQKRNGIIVLGKAEVQALYNFENEAFRKNVPGYKPDFETTWSITLGDRFTASATCSTSGTWKHVWTIDNAFFELPETEVIPMFKKLKVILSLM
jgi:hypothetical protein